MRTAPSYTPVVGMRVRRTLGERAGDTGVIIRVIPADGYTNIQLRYDDDGATPINHAENYEPIEAAAPAQPLFRVGQEVIISERMRELWSYPLYTVADDTPLAIGEEVEIVGPETRLTDIGAPAENVGMRGRVAEVPRRNDRFAGGFSQRVDITTPVASGYHYPVANLRRITALGPRPAEAPAAAAWRLARAGEPTASLMDYLWTSIASPIDNLSRLRGTWTQLLVHRALLKVRRQVPNSYEEQLVKGHDYASSRLWQQAWAAASRGGR